MSTTGLEIDPNGVNHPKGYNSHPSGIETIEVIRHMPFDLGCVFKYIVRWKDKDGAKDLKKAQWYLGDLLLHPPTLAQMITSGKVKFMLQEYVRAEENENAKGAMQAVLDYCRGTGPEALERCKKLCNQLQKEAEA